MGCDIHTVAQIKDYKDIWETVGENIGNEWRSYDSYAVLSDVRNGYGFAGCDTGEGWEPISKPRGLPDDFEIDDEQLHKRKWMGDHSHSYVTLKELKEKLESYKNNSYEIHGYVSVKQFLEIKKGVLPKIWSAGISGADIKIVNEEDYNDEKDVTHIKTKWSVSALDSLTYLINCVKQLELFKECSYSSNELTDNDVRMVFGFDS